MLATVEHLNLVVATSSRNIRKCNAAHLSSDLIIQRSEIIFYAQIKGAVPLIMPKLRDAGLATPSLGWRNGWRKKLFEKKTKRVKIGSGWIATIKGGRNNALTGSPGVFS